MNRWFAASLMVVGILAVSGQQALPQTAGAKTEPQEALVSIYHVAPGKHLDFLKWMAAREAVDQSLGLAPTKWYAHLDGDSWDYVAVGPALTDEQDEQVESEAGRRGLTTGFAAGIELRHFIRSHTDTTVLGPLSAADLVSAAQGR